MEALRSQNNVERKEKPDPGSASVTIPASPFMQKLGYGTGVNVYLMKRSPRGLSRSPWAVKKINPKCNRNQQSLYQQRLNDEAKILKSLQHPNIVGYRAFTEANDGSMCLAMEYGGEKSLGDLIEERNTARLGPFPAATILKVALSMARGLKYLHNDKKLLHGDIKSSNVVIKGDFEAVKICDVGVSLPLDENMTVSDPEVYYIGTEPWKPKEALQDDGVITDKADIFAFGLTLWEMMTLSVPHLNLGSGTDDEDESFDEDDFDEEAYYAALGTRPALNMEELDPSYQHVIELFSICTSEEPQKRPSAAHIVAALEASLPPQ
ncbi:lymphokine-activated killer T-cell-originated protein kinase isoform X1 [Cygnus atratus]|uniref:lymphokine-activated killer T-cell-originated protein kinase isoform X1 n=1 Tax=Cygnus atratus TaxID=8868 RepID=UPI0015D62D55|nr:lymphokine-activated killer T-cell-originated protein kinase isoform X1 [Cygnus atratus]